MDPAINTDPFDLAVIGGGINGAGIARDAAGRGLRVLLVERDDLASHTSSASTKLAHGGLRYLEQGHLGLVRQSLHERGVLLRTAPHLCRPLRFVMPQGQRPAWQLRVGLWLYDRLAGQGPLPGSSPVALGQHAAGAALQAQHRQGFVYSDAWVDDARLVIANAQDARARGATVLTRTRCIRAARAADASHWQLELQAAGSRPLPARCRALVNATGPWAARFLHEATPCPPRHRVRLVRGSHIVVPALFDHDHAYILQNPDGRIVFAIPWQGHYTMIGTTEAEHPDDPADARASALEVAYLCESVGRYFRRTPTPAEVLWSFAGVRPLLDDGTRNASKVSREHLLDLDTASSKDGAALLTVWGGKLTTYRAIAEQAVDLLAPRLGSHAPAWTAHVALPGGDIPSGDMTTWLAGLLHRHPGLPPRLLQRWARSYGSACSGLLDGVHTLADLGEEVLPGLHARELDYLIDQEWARSAQDVLWRRSKLGLQFAPDGIEAAEARLDRWLLERLDGDRR
ncbi:glycerol-3-phosphate dehydrogenase [Uliginosibacterium sp. H1]|uniref:glycerol-3-phosphate dehydrogenase n=1 Tax=Uliginosibacterium sp. H1 TaxID=3114757 RepID=UPI002E17EB01|nr:glycerol-3-phosphate dehydrogenase [Uliginosibacterium sp. H1]